VPLTSFSGGQRQAIAIGLAFSRDTRLVLLDEFTASLDEHTSRRVANAALDRASGIGSTAAIIMHNLELAKSLNKRNIYLELGLVVNDSGTE